jgi:DDE superfamily endonuclease
VLVVDETGDLKKGTATVGVARQYTGTAGKVDNAQVAVYLAYATTAGHGVIHRELYLPKGWLADAERCQVAGVRDQVGFAASYNERRALGQRRVQQRQSQGAERERLTGRQERFPSASTVRADLGERFLAQRFPGFC